MGCGGEGVGVLAQGRGRQMRQELKLEGREERISMGLALCTEENWHLTSRDRGLQDGFMQTNDKATDAFHEDSSLGGTEERVCVAVCLGAWWVTRVSSYLQCCIEHGIESLGNGDKTARSGSRDN